jgi:uncharacterized membrane protein YhaH (DUF805 family)
MKMPLSQLLFSTKGRIPRSTYWYYGFVYLGINIVAVLIDLMTGTYDDSLGIGLVSGLLSLIGIVTGIAVSVKRCHDRDHSGWFLLVGLIPLVNLWVTIELGFLRGTVGENQYGYDPT